MIIGTAGHIDHGKTTLVRALTGVDTDRLKEEKARGISIDLGFAYLPAPSGDVLGFVDVPGHEKFVHNMLAGAGGIDYALLVVAADDGVMPQTREHLAILDLLGISDGIVALTKTDRVDGDLLVQRAAEIRQCLAGTALDCAEVMLVSAASGAGVDALRARLFERAASMRLRGSQGRFRLSVDRCFTLSGAGTIVTGTVLSGSVRVGDRLMVSPSGRAARVRSIHAQDRPAQQGIAGQRCALNLAGEDISRDTISRGDVVLDPRLHAPTDRIDARLRLLASETRPLTQWTPVHLHHGASDVPARIVLLQDDPIAPGEDGFVQLVLDHPVAAAQGDRFVLRDTTAQRTMAGGSFVDLRPPARKRRTPDRLTQLAALSAADPMEAFGALLDVPPFVVDLDQFARDRALDDGATADLAVSASAHILKAAASRFAISAAKSNELAVSIIGALTRFHEVHPDLQGIGLQKLRTMVEPVLPVAVLVAFLDALVDSGALAIDGAWVRLASHDVRLTAPDEQLWDDIQPLLGGDERFRPPRVRDIAHHLGRPEPDIRRLLKLLSRMGRLDEVAHDHFFLRDTVAEMAEIVADVSAATPGGQFTAAQFRDRVDNGRKVAIQILEFFDRHGVTLRRGDLRRMNRHRIDLFRRRRETRDDPAAYGRESSPVGRPDFKSGGGRETVPGGFDSLSLPPASRAS